MSAVILCPAVCVCDVMIKAGTCGSSACDVMSQPFSAFHWKRASQYGCTLRDSLLTEQHTEPAKGNIDTVSTFSGQLLSSREVPFKVICKLARRLSNQIKFKYISILHNIYECTFFPLTHQDQASCDDRSRVFSDELRVSSFP